MMIATGCHIEQQTPNLGNARSMLYLLSHTCNKTLNPGSISATLCPLSSRGHGIPKEELKDLSKQDELKQKEKGQTIGQGQKHKI